MDPEWKLIAPDSYSDTIKNLILPKNLEDNFGIDEFQLKKAIRPPLALFQNDTKKAVFVTLDKQYLIGRTLVNPANLLRHEANMLNLFVNLEHKNLFGMVPARLKISGYSCALSPKLNFIYDNEANNSKLQLLLIDLNTFYLLVLFINTDLHIEDVKNIIAISRNT